MIEYKTLTKQEKIVVDNWIPGLQQNPNISDDHSIKELILNMRNGKYAVIEDSGLLLLIAKETYWIGRVHLFSENKKYDYISAGKRIFKHIFDNSEMQLIYGYSHNKKFVNTVMKGGMDFIGVLENCYEKDGKFIDNYIFSVQRENFYNFLQKSPILEENE